MQCGPGSSNGKTLDYGLDDPGSIPGVGGGGDFTSFLRIQTAPGVHSTGKFLRGKAAECRTSLFLVPWLRICGPLHPHPPWASMACNGDTFTCLLNAVYEI